MTTKRHKLKKTKEGLIMLTSDPREGLMIQWVRR